MSNAKRTSEEGDEIKSKRLIVDSTTILGKRSTPEPKTYLVHVGRRGSGIPTLEVLGEIKKETAKTWFVLDEYWVRCWGGKTRAHDRHFGEIVKYRKLTGVLQLQHGGLLRCPCYFEAPHA